jgi:hypothetical protein
MTCNIQELFVENWYRTWEVFEQEVPGAQKSEMKPVPFLDIQEQALCGDIEWNAHVLYKGRAMLQNHMKGRDVLGQLLWSCGQVLFI